MHAMLSRTMLVLGVDCGLLNDSADIGQTLFELTRHRREAMNGRLPCAVRLCIAQRAPVVRGDITRPLDCVSIENAQDSRSTRAMVIHLKASKPVRHSVATSVANDTARSGPRDRLAALFEKAREFDEPAKRASIATGSRHGVHSTCTQCYPAPCWCSE
jgi:hypothetical protein